MKSQKKFVRFTDFEINNANKTPTNRQNKEVKRNPKKNYQEKKKDTNNNRIQNAKSLLNYFQKVSISERVQVLTKQFPKFFSNVSKKPQSQNLQNLNQYIIFYPRKQSQVVKQIQISSDEEPNWDSGSQQDFSLASKVIDQKVANEVNEKYKHLAVKKMNQLKKHEEQFLAHHFKTKKRQLQEQQAAQQKLKPSKSQKILKQSIQQSVLEVVKQEKNVQKPKQQNKHNNPFESWLGFGIDSGTNGWIEKIQNDDDDFGNIQQDDGMFEMASQKSQKQKSSQSSDEDDAFVDQQPTTIQYKKSETKEAVSNNTTKNKIGKGVVVISTYFFSEIADKIGLSPAACVWIISNRKERYKVTTEYMDQYYRQHKIYEHYPYIALNHSEFVHHDEISTDKALQKFKRYQQRGKNYKQRQQKPIKSKSYKNINNQPHKRK